MSDRPYCRIYYVDLERDYPEVWASDAQLATFVRLLSRAEASWPIEQEVPRSARASIVQRLVDATLVERSGRFSYRIKGMDAERNARSNAARNAAASRWAMPNQTKPNQTETEPNPARGIDVDTDDPAVTYSRLAGQMPSDRGIKWLDDLSAEYGSDAVSRKLAAVWADGPPNKAISRCQDALKADARKKPRPRYGLDEESKKLAEWMFGGKDDAA